MHNMYATYLYTWRHTNTHVYVHTQFKLIFSIWTVGFYNLVSQMYSCKSHIASFLTMFYHYSGTCELLIGNYIEHLIHTMLGIDYLFAYLSNCASTLPYSWHVITVKMSTQIFVNVIIDLVLYLIIVIMVYTVLACLTNELVSVNKLDKHICLHCLQS